MEVENLCQETFTQYEKRLSVKDLMIANLDWQFVAAKNQNLLMSQKAKEARKKSAKMIIGFSVGGFSLGVGITALAILLLR